MFCGPVLMFERHYPPRAYSSRQRRRFAGVSSSSSLEVLLARATVLPEVIYSRFSQSLFKHLTAAISLLSSLFGRDAGGREDQRRR